MGRLLICESNSSIKNLHPKAHLAQRVSFQAFPGLQVWETTEGLELYQPLSHSLHFCCSRALHCAAPEQEEEGIETRIQAGYGGKGLRSQLLRSGGRKIRVILDYIVSYPKPGLQNKTTTKPQSLLSEILANFHNTHYSSSQALIF